VSAGEHERAAAGRDVAAARRAGPPRKRHSARRRSSDGSAGADGAADPDGAAAPAAAAAVRRDDAETATPAAARAKGEASREREGSRERLLRAATAEFARFGLLGARVDVIARKAGVNKQLIYYHFGGKDALYAAVLDEVYADIRGREHALNLSELPPETAMERLIGFTFDYLSEHPEFVALLTDENVHRGVHLTGSARLGQLRSPFLSLIAETLARGEAAGVFRSGVDPMHFYISLAGICFFYRSNTYTLSALFDRDLRQPEEQSHRRAHVFEFVMGTLRP
jgi:TetR/AcrR family transcriptional regulator